MAYIPYGQATAGGKQIAERMASLLRDADVLRDLMGWVGGIGVSDLTGHPDFGVEVGDYDVGVTYAQAFYDSLDQINADMVTFMTTNREKIERLARGS